MTTTIAILKAARDLIAKPENWLQGTYAKNENGRDVSALSHEGVCFCAMGALLRAGWVHPSADDDAVVAVLNQVPDDMLIAEFNDQATHSEVLDLFSKAISSAEEKQGAAS